MNRRMLPLLLVIVLCAALLGGCGAKNQANELAANPWVATQVLTPEGHTAVLSGTTPAIYFRSDGTVIGNSTVNTFRGPYALKGRTLGIGPLETSAWAGPQMESAQDKLVQAALSATSRYVIQKGVLQLSDSSGQLLMSMQVAPAPKLVGPTWICVSLVAATGKLASVVGSEPIAAAFAPDGTLAGFGGVNTYSTMYAVAGTTSGSEMRISPDITSTKMAGPEELMTQETSYLNALTRTATYKIEGYQLTLLDKYGIPSVVFIPGSPKK